MILKQAVIEGFGKWYDETVDFRAEGLTCLYGKNESGKSTLYQFILFMLFGFPPRKRELYRPKTGAKMGGRLIIDDETTGEYTIERYDAVKNGKAICYTVDGKVHDEEWLSETLNGMTYETYQSIFSFAANDLAGIDDLKGEDLGNVLLNIGLTGSKNIQKIEKQLDAQMAELFKPYGKKPVINEQLVNLKESYHTLNQAEQEEASYQEITEKLAGLETEQEQLKDSLKEKKQSLSDCKKKLQTLTLIQQYHDNINQLETYPEVISFPEDGINRLKSLKEQLLPLKSEQTVLRDSLQTYCDQQQKLSVKQYDRNDCTRASELLEEAKTYFHKANELAQLQETKQEKEIEIETKLSQLNVGITKEELESISLNFYTEDIWNKLANDSNQLKMEWEQFEQEKRVATKRRDNLAAEKTAKEAQILSGNDLEHVMETIENYQKQPGSGQADKNREWQMWKQRRKVIASYSLTGSVVIAIISGIILWQFSVTAAWMVPIIVLFAGTGIRFGINHSIQSMEKVLQAETAPLSTVVTEQDYQEARQQMADHERYAAELVTNKEQIKKNDGYLLTLSERQNTLEIKQERLDQRLGEQYAMYPFLEQVDVTYWLSLYHTLQQLLDVDNEIRRIMEQSADLEQHTATFEQQVRMFFQEKNWESGNETVEQQVRQLQQVITEYQQTKERIDQYERLIQEQTEQLETVNKRLSVYEKEQMELYKAAGVTTEEDFFRQAKKQDDKHHVYTKLSETKAQLLSFFSLAEWKKLRNETLDEKTLTAEQEELQSRIDSYESELEANRQEIADLSAEISNLEKSDRYSTLLHRFYMEQEQLEKLAGKWYVLKTAKALLAETKRNYQDKYIAKVIGKTKHYFQLLTNHIYRDVIVPEDGSLMNVVADNGLRYTVNELSKGTTDQLYVSLRLAISETMMKEHGFPFIIDDAFVHFDSLRTKNVMKILEEMAAEQQILVLSCKEDVKNSVCNGKVVCLEKTVRISS